MRKLDKLMPTTFAALAIAAIAILPGAVCYFAYESQVGSYGVSLPDRITRFLAVSALLHAMFAGYTYHFYASKLATRELQSGRISPWLLELFALTYLVVPYVIGWSAGKVRLRGWQVIEHLSARSPAPTAWEHFFSHAKGGILLMRLKSGTWLAGTLGPTSHDAISSYASGHPEAGDLLLSSELAIDAETGLLEVDEFRRPRTIGNAILIRWTEIEFFKYIQENNDAE